MIKAIFATDLEGGLGKNGTLPWPHDKQDMQWFSTNTRGHVVVMGSNTWLDPAMPKPLKDRHCVVVTNQDVSLFPEAHDVIAGSMLIPSLEVLALNHIGKDIWIIGGAKLINSTKHLFQKIYVTTFYDNYDCDVKIDMGEMLSRYEMDYQSYGKNKIFGVYNAKLQRPIIQNP
jgi:dihydrofolate reductase